MPLPTPEPGLVVSYAYLWYSEYEEGREEGVKDRPCVVIVAVNTQDGKLVVTAAPVTHSMPAEPESAVEIPLATKQRLGLDAARSWVVVDEVNDFIWPGPDLRAFPNDPGRFAYGLLPPGLFRQVRNRMAARGASGLFQTVRRTE
jgi:hypothetical protein